MRREGCVIIGHHRREAQRQRMVLTMAQFRIGLMREGLMTPAAAKAPNLPPQLGQGRPNRDEIDIRWAADREVRWSCSLTEAAAEAFGWSDADRDAFFVKYAEV